MGQGKSGAGGRSTLIKIQSNPRASDGFGGQDNEGGEWVDKFTAWAKMEKGSGREAFANRQRSTRSGYKFTMDFQLANTVLTTDRVLVGTRTFNIFDVDNVGEMNRTLIVRAEEGRPD